MCPADSWDAAMTISDWTYVDEDETAMMEALVTLGPLSVLLDASQLVYYRGGVWTGKADASPNWSTCGDYLNHAVLLVGYGHDEDSGLDYWIVKNSWGEDWGENGYFRMERGVALCGITLQVTTALL
jgi:C1A family cysteine protease